MAGPMSVLSCLLLCASALSLLGYSRATSAGPQEDNVDRSRQEFIILTTGEHIKLYPMVEGKDEDGSRTWTPSDDPYHIVLKPVRPWILESSGDNALTRWLAGRAKTRNATSGPLTSRQPRYRDSITSAFGGVDADTDDRSYAGNSGYKRPWIVDVDYFYNPNPNWCDPFNLDPRARPECLVVVWLDPVNMFVRSGSVDLANSPIETRRGDSLATTRRRLLTMDELPPVSIPKLLGVDSCEVQSLTADRDRNLVHVLANSGRENFLVSWKLGRSHATSGYWSTINKVYNYPRNHEELPDQLLNGPLSTQIILDRTHGDMYFASPSGWYLPIGDGRRSMVEEASAAVAGYSSEDQSVYYLNRANEIYRSKLTEGGYFELAAKLPLKPIRSPFSLQVHRGHVYISDTTKKTLISYNLGPQPERQVLLVEAPTILGFRIVSVPRKSFTDSEDIEDQTPMTLARRLDVTESTSIETKVIFDSGSTIKAIYLIASIALATIALSALLIMLIFIKKSRSKAIKFVDDQPLTKLP